MIAVAAKTGPFGLPMSWRQYAELSIDTNQIFLRNSDEIITVEIKEMFSQSNNVFIFITHVWAPVQELLFKVILNQWSVYFT